jgi:hypothetical protein
MRPGLLLSPTHLTRLVLPPPEACHVQFAKSTDKHASTFVQSPRKNSSLAANRPMSDHGTPSIRGLAKRAKPATSRKPESCRNKSPWPVPSIYYGELAPICSKMEVASKTVLFLSKKGSLVMRQSSPCAGTRGLLGHGYVWALHIVLIHQKNQHHPCLHSD